MYIKLTQLAEFTCFVCVSYSVPGVTIATDIICGFPTENEEVGFICVLLHVVCLFVFIPLS